MRSRVSRVILVIGGLIAAVGAWSGAAHGQFTAGGTACWVAAVCLAWWSLAPPRLRSGTTWEVSWTLAAGLGASLLLAAALRVWSFDEGPPEMTSDHVEKLLDVLRIESGDRPVYLSGNGGREALHFYFLVVLRRLTGLPAAFRLLKLASVLEGLLSIVAAAFLARELVGRSDPRRADLAAVAAALVLAVSHWHVLLSRLGLRLALTPLFFALVALPLVRAVRTGSPRAFCATGLLLGLSLYGYQANRALPLLVVAAIAAAVPLTPGGDGRRALARGLVMAALLAASAALPLLRFMVDSPGDFWGRAAGRITGQDGGAVAVSGYATAIRDHAPILLRNLGRTFGMPFYRTDQSWFTGVPSGAPGLDPLCAALLAIGLWGQLRSGLGARDPAAWMPVLGLVIGLLPSALAISRPAEVPHASRSGGALPFAAVLAGDGAVLLCGIAVGERARGPRRWAAAATAFGLLAAAATWNARVYWTGAMGAYRLSAQPHRRAAEAVLGIDRRSGGQGNVFILPWPHWLDHRAVLLEAGRVEFDVVPDAASDAAFDELIARRLGRSAYDPRRPSLFLLHPEDAAGFAWLRTRYPDGTFEELSPGSTKPLGLFLAPGTR